MPEVHTLRQCVPWVFSFKFLFTRMRYHNLIRYANAMARLWYSVRLSWYDTLWSVYDLHVVIPSNGIFYDFDVFIDHRIWLSMISMLSVWWSTRADSELKKKLKCSSWEKIQNHEVFYSNSSSKVFWVFLLGTIFEAIIYYNRNLTDQKIFRKSDLNRSADTERSFLANGRENFWYCLCGGLSRRKKASCMEQQRSLLRVHFTKPLLEIEKKEKCPHLRHLCSFAQENPVKSIIELR